MTSFQDFQDRIDELIFGFIDDNGDPDCLNSIEDMIYWEAKRIIDYSIRHHIQQELDEFEELDEFD